MAKQIFYDKLENFDRVFMTCILDKRSFKLTSTTYTKRIALPECTIVFNESGFGDTRILHLIQKVRTDADNYTAKHTIKTKEDIKFFDLTQKPKETLVAKIDLTSAYWKTALDMGVVTKKTDEYLNTHYKNHKQLKQARLKSLGALATRKEVQTYISGEYIRTDILTQETRDLYIEICGMVDTLMQDISQEFTSVFYYYWDCVFAETGASSEIINFIAKQKYSCKQDYVETKVIKQGCFWYILAYDMEKKGEQFTLVENYRDTAKMYLVRKEQDYLINLR